MKRTIITISDNGAVTVPSNTRMTISEIAELLGSYYQTAKRTIRTIEKLGIANGDYSKCCTVDGQKVYPEYYGLEMIIAVAFRVQSHRAEIFRKWLLRMLSNAKISEILMRSIQNQLLNLTNLFHITTAGYPTHNLPFHNSVKVISRPTSVISRSWLPSRLEVRKPTRITGCPRITFAANGLSDHAIT